ncbi:MAG: hypothetical protein BWY26_01410 [Elusimicrobia bacterium ADurb.Bin231]|nr:MAG: hypothetical protein BWY26_01410 [Elusimicrobia bacterium ADurb.Bin231]
MDLQLSAIIYQALITLIILSVISNIMIIIKMFEIVRSLRKLGDLLKK